MKTKYLLQLTLGLVVGAFGIADALAEKPLFNNENLLEAVLTAPISDVYKQKKKDVRLYMDGTLSYKNDNGAVEKLNVKVRTRGNFRRFNCIRPPLRLNFVKNANDGTLFEKQNKLKLVGPCQKGPNYQQYLNLEYLAYKIWQEVSEFHFKTRLIEMRYLDSGGKRKPWTSTTFIIEDEHEMAKRFKRKPVKLEKIARQQLHRHHMQHPLRD